MSQIESQFLYLKNFLPTLNIKKRKKYCKELGNIFKNIISDPNVLFDERDYSLYSIIKIGNQTWMAENLRYNIESSRLNPMNPSIEYGKLYNWNTVMKATPKGWHLPSDEEWNELEMALGMPAVDVTNTGWRRGTDHGTGMKSTTGWYNSGNGTNASGFNAFPAGFYSGSFHYLGDNASFWSSTENSGSHAWYRFLHYGGATVNRLSTNKTYSFSCRCVKD